MAAKLSPNTLVNYRSQWGMFQRWCEQVGCTSLPAKPETCIAFARWCIASGFRLQTVLVRLKAINHFHCEAELPLPVNRAVNHFFRNTKYPERPGRKQPVTSEQLRRISQSLLTGSAIHARDRALLLLCLVSGWGPSDLVSFDVRWPMEGIKLFLVRTKDAQESEVHIDPGDDEITCPIKALNEWTAVRGKWPGPLFTHFAPNHGGATRKRISRNGVSGALRRALAR